MVMISVEIRPLLMKLSIFIDKNDNNNTKKNTYRKKKKNQDALVKEAGAPSLSSSCSCFISCLQLTGMFSEQCSQH